MSSSNVSAETFLTVHHYQPCLAFKMLPIDFKAATAAAVRHIQRAWMNRANMEPFGWEFL